MAVRRLQVVRAFRLPCMLTLSEKFVPTRSYEISDGTYFPRSSLLASKPGFAFALKRFGSLEQFGSGKGCQFCGAVERANPMTLGWLLISHLDVSTAYLQWF